MSRPCRSPCRSCPWRASTPQRGFPGGFVDVVALLDMIAEREPRAMGCHGTSGPCIGFAIQYPNQPQVKVAHAFGLLDLTTLACDEPLLTLEELVAKHGGG